MNKKNEIINPIYEKLSVVFNEEAMIGPREGNSLLIPFLQHCFTPEEAEVALHLPFFYSPVKIEKITKSMKKQPQEIKPILDAMVEKGTIRGRAKGYALLPVLPGMFENVLMDNKETPWHIEFARLANELYETGYVRTYLEHPMKVVRSIPIGVDLGLKSHVLNEDHVELMIRSHDKMAVIHNCQCRQAKYLLGDECKKADRLDGCIAFGDFATGYIERGGATEIDKDSMRSIIQDRRDKNLVFFAGNVSASSNNQICTCCDCCCHMLGQIVNVDPEYIVSPPRYKVIVNDDKCNNCGKCLAACNTLAHTVAKRQHYFDQSRCIGCGLCLGICPTAAIELIENPLYRAPSKNFKTLAIRLAPAKIMSMVKAKFK